MKYVMTVTGPITAAELGVTLMHEHITFAFPGWYADNSLAPYNRPQILQALHPILTELAALKVQTIVDATPADTGGRDPRLLKQLSEATGIHIIASTGLYTQNSGAYPYYHWQSTMGGRDLEQDIYELMMRELTVGIGDTKIKAGVIKVATSDPDITEYEQAVIRAGVRASRDTQTSMITHTSGGTVGTKQQSLLLSLGMDPTKVVIGHQNNATDLNYHHAQLENAGFYLGFDRTNPLMENVVTDNIITLIKQGFAQRLMLSHDCIFHWLGRPIILPEAFQLWKPDYIYRYFLPKLRAAGIDQATIDQILIDNPARCLTHDQA